MRHAPQPLLWSPPIGQPSDRSISAQSRLQIRERCWRRRRSQRRRQQLPLLSNVPRSDAGVLGPPCTTKAPPGARRPVRWHPLRTAAGAPTTAVAPPLMEGRSAPLLPRRRWEGHWWWPGRPSAAARRAASKGRYWGSRRTGGRGGGVRDRAGGRAGLGLGRGAGRDATQSHALFMSGRRGREGEGAGRGGGGGRRDRSSTMRSDPTQCRVCTRNNERDERGRSPAQPKYARGARE